MERTSPKIDLQSTEQKRKEPMDSSVDTNKIPEAAKPLPLHRRRFDAKQRVFPTELTALPNESSSVDRPSSESSRKFCEDLAERLRKDENSIEELQPLFVRTANTAVAALATEDAFDHLDKLYRLMDQLLTLKDQKSKIQRHVREMEHIKKLREMHRQIEMEILKTKNADTDTYLKNEITSMDLGEEYEYTEALLDSMLAAGRNASLKRAKWKTPARSKLRQSIVRNQRSRSMGGEELEMCPLQECDHTRHLVVPYKGRPRTRRPSDGKTSGEKSKISKWTRVKAAFKWEKAHTGIAGETPSHALRTSMSLGAAGSPLTPISPSTPAVTPASISSASSVEDLGDAVTRRHDNSRRSRSLDSSVILEPLSGQLNQEEEMSSPSSSKMHKTPWGKMKDIIQTRKESVRKKQNRNSVRSTSDGRTSENYSFSDGGGLSQSESAEVLHNADVRIPRRKTSSQEKSEISLQDLSDSARRTTPTLTITMPSSEELTTKRRENLSSSASQSSKSNQSCTDVKMGHQILRKQKSLDMAKKLSGRPANGIPQDSSDADTGSPIAQRHDSKWKKVKKAFLTSAPASTPSSPSRNSAFFSYEPDDLTSNDHTQQSRGDLEEDIRRDYKALQNRLNKEFCEKASEWSSGGISIGALSSNSSGGQSPSQRSSKKIDDWEKSKSFSGGKQALGSSPPTPGEERFSGDFKKKVDWHKSKPPISNAANSSFANVPSQAQLSEDFLKKLEEWKKLKATNSVPSYTIEDTDRLSKDHDKDEKPLKLKKAVGPQKKEVLVQTGAGFFRFEGISRSFTRKLYEWEKSRGIAPEVSTSALLRESLARPPLPITRMTGYGPWPRISNASYQKCDRGGMRLQRSLSVGSVRDESTPHISASASSLSLNQLDECNDITENQISDIGEECFDTSLDIENRPMGTESDSDGGPGAVLVEIEDEIEETAAPLVACSPCAAPQTPIYRYGQAQERHRACENTEGKLSPIAQAISIPPHPCTEKILNLKNAVSQLIEEEETLQKLIIGRKNVKDRCDDVSKKIEDMKGQPSKISSRLGDMERRIGRLNKEGEIIQNTLKERVKNFNATVSKFYSIIEQYKISCNGSISTLKKSENLMKQVNIFKDINAERTNMINAGIMCDRNLTNELKNISDCLENLKNSDNNLCLSYVVTKPKVKDIKKEESFDKQILETTEVNDKKSNLEKVDLSSDRDVSVTFKCSSFKSDNLDRKLSKVLSDEDKSDDSKKGAKKKLKDVNDKAGLNSVKRKSKARQRHERERSIHTETDTDEDVNTVTVEIPKRKKLSKSKCIPDTHIPFPRQNSFEKQSNTDSGDNVFVLKLKSTRPEEQSIINYEKDSPISERYTKRTVLMKKKSFESASESKSEKSLIDQDSVEIIIPEQLSITLPADGIEVQTTDESYVRPDIFVKTTRKIFSPVRRESTGETKAVIGFDLEEIANSIRNRKSDLSKEIQSQENLPDIIVNNEKKMFDNAKSGSKDIIYDTADITNLQNQIKFDDHRKPYKIYGSESLSNIRSHSPSPLMIRKNSSSKMIPSSRNDSEESLYHSKDALYRRGSGERFPNGCKGSPILSRASTPGINGATSALPPLPASPPTARRDKPPIKETAPSIRIMIQKYNMRLNEEGGDTRPQGGGSTPPWRSPRSQERFPHDVRRMLHQSVKNNPFVDREVQKSASASQIMKNQTNNDHNYSTRSTHSFSRENISDPLSMTPPLPKKMLRGILKSSSVGSLKTTSPLSQRKEFEMIKNSEDSLTSKGTIEYLDQDISNIGDKQISKVENTKDVTETVNDESEKKSALDENIQIKNRFGIYGKKIDSNLLRLAKSSSCGPMQPTDICTNYPLYESSCSRAIKLRKAKEQFLASSFNIEKDDNNMRKDRNTSSNIDLAENRLSQISCSSDVSYEGNSSSAFSNGNYDTSHLIKSASVGMINVEREAFDKFNRSKGYESLPRNKAQDSEEKEHVSKSASKFGLSNLASKFRKVRMRSKNRQVEKGGEKEKLDTVTKLCRQSLLVNLHVDNTANTANKQSDAARAIDLSHTKTDKHIVLAGKTGGAIAVSNEDAFSHVDRNIHFGMPATSNASSGKKFK